MTREAWLLAAVDALRPMFANQGHRDIPDRVHVSVGFSFGSRKRSATLLGQCWTRAASDDGVNHIFIAPHNADVVTVLATLVHELVHAADDNQSGHRGEFARIAKRVGLTGKMTSTWAGPELREALTVIAGKLGPFPSARLVVADSAPRKRPTESGPVTGLTELPDTRLHSGPPKQGTRMLKLACECGYTVRTTQKWIDIGLPACPDGHELAPQ